MSFFDEIIDIDSSDDNENTDDENIENNNTDDASDSRLVRRLFESSDDDLDTTEFNSNE